MLASSLLVASLLSSALPVRLESTVGIATLGAPFNYYAGPANTLAVAVEPIPGMSFELGLQLGVYNSRSFNDVTWALRNNVPNLGMTVDISSQAMQLGYRQYWHNDMVTPYLGAGLRVVLVHSRRDCESAGCDPYAHDGVFGVSATVGVEKKFAKQATATLGVDFFAGSLLGYYTLLTGFSPQLGVRMSL